MTIVQKYYLEENTNLTHDEKDIEKWGQLTEKLGLKGQLGQKVNMPGKAPIPFQLANTKMKNIINQLCEREVNIKDYNAGTIPLEVLEMIEMCEREKYFQNLIIQYDEESPDPFLLGLVGHWHESTYYNDSNKSLENKEFKSKEEIVKAGGKHINFSSKNCYLIAKWGDVKRSMEDLRRMAIERFVKFENARTKKQIIELKAELEKIDNEAILKFG